MVKIGSKDMRITVKILSKKGQKISKEFGETGTDRQHHISIYGT